MEAAGAVTSRANPAYLPTDIIVQLFYALADVYPSRAPWRVRSSRGDLRGGTPGSLGWIVMTHVCQRWRGVGLDLSVLWADIVCAFPSAIKDIAQRTKTTPLTLDLSWTREPDDYLDAMDGLDLISRARTLEIAEFSGLTLDSGNDSSRFLLNRTFSHLQSLSILLDNFTDHIAKRLNPVTATGLRSLTTNVPLAIVAPSLTSLRAEGAIWHYKLLLEYIRQYPLLADLYIDAIYGDSFDDVDISLRSLETSIQMGNRIAQASTVCLSHLRSLSFMVAGLQAIRFLQYLETPNCTKFEIEEVWDETALADLLAQSNQYRGPCNTLTIYDMRNNDCGVNIVFTELEPYLNRQPTFTRGSMLCYHMMDDDANEIPGVLSAIPLPSSIHTLALDHNCRRCRDWECGSIARGIGLEGPFLSSLKRFRNVTSLYLKGQDGMIDAAGLIASGISPDEWIFPLLRELVIDLTLNTTKEWWAGIREALSARQVAGRQVDRVVVRGTGACHAWPRNESDQEAARSQIMEGAMDNNQIAAWLRNYEITLDPERQVVTEVVDERMSEYDCECLSDVLNGDPPWDFLAR